MEFKSEIRKPGGLKVMSFGSVTFDQSGFICIALLFFFYKRNMAQRVFNGVPHHRNIIKCIKLNKRTGDSKLILKLALILAMVGP